MEFDVKNWIRPNMALFEDPKYPILIGLLHRGREKRRREKERREEERKKKRRSREEEKFKEKKKSGMDM